MGLRDGEQGSQINSEPTVGTTATDRPHRFPTDRTVAWAATVEYPVSAGTTGCKLTIEARRWNFANRAPLERTSPLCRSFALAPNSSCPESGPSGGLHNVVAPPVPHPGANPLNACPFCRLQRDEQAWPPKWSWPLKMGAHGGRPSSPDSPNRTFGAQRERSLGNLTPPKSVASHRPLCGPARCRPDQFPGRGAAESKRIPSGSQAPRTTTLANGRQPANDRGHTTPCCGDPSFPDKGNDDRLCALSPSDEPARTAELSQKRIVTDWLESSTSLFKSLSGPVRPAAVSLAFVRLRRLSAPATGCVPLDLSRERGYPVLDLPRFYRRESPLRRTGVRFADWKPKGRALR
uniref:Uncharacterized protein n=1 Tax=Trichuris muris TaxID=70415 RepID=A0A5S6Q7W7_TRIMR